MLKKRVITIAITLGLFIIYVGIGSPYIYGVTGFAYPKFARAMLVATMIYTMGGCMLHTFGYHKLAQALSTIVFVLLCIYLFYSTKLIDFICFILCMFIVLKRAVTVCGDNCNIEQKHENP